MRVLILSNTPFLPATAGNCARIARMVEYLTGAGHEVAMCMLPDADTPSWDVAGMRARLAWLEIGAAPSSLVASVARRTLGGLGRLVRRRADAGPRSIGVDDWCPGWFRARARAHVREWQPDVVLVEYVFLSACLEGLDAPPRCVTVIDTHDLMHRRQAAYAALGMPPQWFHTTWAEERRGLLRADLVLAIHAEDAAVLRAMIPERRVLTVPHAHPMHAAPPGAAAAGRLLFVASFNDLNVRGLEWLLDAVWPALRRAVPGVELVVCGTIAAKLGTLPPGVVARGFVADLTAEYGAARVVVSPARGGTGLKVKVIEALCHGRPIVTTRASATGLDTGETTGVLVADDAEAFTAALVALLGDDARWRRLASAAAAHAARRYTPEAVFASMVAAWEHERAAPRSAAPGGVAPATPA